MTPRTRVLLILSGLLAVLAAASADALYVEDRCSVPSIVTRRLGLGDVGCGPPLLPEDPPTPRQPSAPRLYAEGSDHSVLLAWTPSAPVTALWYIVERRLDTNETNATDWAAVADVPFTNLSHVDDGLPKGVAFRYRVIGFAGLRGPASNEIVAVTCGEGLCRNDVHDGARGYSDQTVEAEKEVGSLASHTPSALVGLALATADMVLHIDNSADRQDAHWSCEGRRHNIYFITIFGGCPGHAIANGNATCSGEATCSVVSRRADAECRADCVVALAVEGNASCRSDATGLYRVDAQLLAAQSYPAGCHAASVHGRADCRSSDRHAARLGHDDAVIHYAASAPCSATSVGADATCEGGAASFATHAPISEVDGSSPRMGGSCVATSAEHNASCTGGTPPAWQTTTRRRAIWYQGGCAAIAPSGHAACRSAHPHSAKHPPFPEEGVRQDGRCAALGMTSAEGHCADCFVVAPFGHANATCERTPIGPHNLQFCLVVAGDGPATCEGGCLALGADPSDGQACLETGNRRDCLATPRCEDTPLPCALPHRPTMESCRDRSGVGPSYARVVQRGNCPAEARGVPGVLIVSGHSSVELLGGEYVVPYTGCSAVLGAVRACA